MKKLIVLVGFIFIISCASDGDQSMGGDDRSAGGNDKYSAHDGPRLYKNAHVIDRPSSPFMGGLNRFTE